MMQVLWALGCQKNFYLWGLKAVTIASSALGNFVSCLEIATVVVPNVEDLARYTTQTRITVYN